MSQGRFDRFIKLYPYDSSMWSLPAIFVDHFPNVSTFITMGVPPSSLDGLFHGKSQSKMDDVWGVPHFRKPPYVYIYKYLYIIIYTI